MTFDKWILAVTLACAAHAASAAGYGFSLSSTQSCPGLDRFTSNHSVGDVMTELRTMPHDVEDANPANQSACTPHYGAYLQSSKSGPSCRIFGDDAIGVALFGMEDSQTKSLMGNGALLYFLSDAAGAPERVGKHLRAEGFARVPDADYPGLIGRKLAASEQLDIYRKGDLLVTLNRDLKQHRLSAMISDRSMLQIVNRDESKCGK
ncbi:hypothetical protein [Burkholderia sp. Ac-20379]|uniref:hypothetical protein n=1 Tax=Burkholderia sp. Ac-20379 TaxID=2703900 RepID=UPI00197F125A|nr:hypothetical protein [Burkholderia sp. Ac-20379]MBN3725055.1 hypothetical protein [Burkholderia sp. Ac-20379]